MSSGVSVNDSCISTYQDLKLKKTLKYIIYTLSKDNTEVVVHKTSQSSVYEEFLADLPENECRWAVYDFEVDKGVDGKRNKLLFYSWSPEVAKIKQKMIFASSKDALRKKLEGIGSEIQGTDSSEVQYDAVHLKVSK